MLSRFSFLKALFATMLARSMSLKRISQSSRTTSSLESSLAITVSVSRWKNLHHILLRLWHICEAQKGDYGAKAFFKGLIILKPSRRVGYIWQHWPRVMKMAFSNVGFGPPSKRKNVAWKVSRVQNKSQEKIEKTCASSPNPTKWRLRSSSCSPTYHIRNVHRPYKFSAIRNH